MKTLLLCLLPFAANAQFTLKGVVVDSVTRQPLAGTNVMMKGDPHVLTNAEGVFIMPHDKISGVLAFSYPGYLNAERTIRHEKMDTIMLQPDPSLNDARHIKAGLEVGYYGDTKYAPTGLIANLDVQAIGTFYPRININGKHWRGGDNTGLELSISKMISPGSPWLPCNVMVNFRELDYDETNHQIRQTRLLLGNELPGFFGLTLGAAYNHRLATYQFGFDQTKYVSLIAGLMKVIDIHALRSSLALNASVNYHGHATMYDAGASLSTWRMTLMAQYYNNSVFEGLILSLRMRLFSTEYYCCDSFSLRYRELNVFR